MVRRRYDDENKRRSTRSSGGSREVKSGRKSRRDSYRNQTDLFTQVNNLFVDFVEDILSSQRSILNNNELGEINIILFSRLANEAKRRSSELIINPSNSGNRSRRNSADNNDFALRLSISIDNRARSRITQIDRTNIYERQSEKIEQYFKNASSGIDNLDSASDILDAYCDTYLTIEEGIADFFDYLSENDYIDDEIIRIVNSAEIYYEYGEFIVFPTAKIDRDGYLNWSLRYETSALIKQTIKNDFSFNNSR